MAGDRRVNYVSVVIGVVALVLGAILAFVIFRPLTPKNTPSPVLNAPIQRAQNLACRAQIRKVETAVQIYAAENGKYPDRLDAVEELSDSDLICPLTNRPYRYDPANGRVSCLGHD
jgi:hypothetical protein